MNIDELTIGQARELSALFGSKQPAVEAGHPYNVGGLYFIRTVTHHHTGKLVRVHPQELVLIDAAWVADDGRLTDSLKSGEFNEVEMFPPNKEVIIGRGSIIDAVQISAIPNSQK